MTRLGSIAGLLFASAAALCPADLSVTGVRYWTLSDVTRVSINVNGEFHYRSDRLEDPDRLFFDIEGAAKAFGSKGIHTVSVQDKLLKRIRVAQSTTAITRIVLDLDGNPSYTASIFTNPNRLVIELRSTAPAAAPSKSAAPPVEAVPPPAAVISKVESPKTPIVPAPAIEHPVIEHKVAVAESKPQQEPEEDSQIAAVPAHRSTVGANTMIRALGLKIGRVVLDPGHGGHDQGTTGPTGLLEKDLVLDVAKRLGALIEERMGSEVIYTRDEDRFVSLEARTEVANQKKADLFLSIHANSSPYPAVSGVETYHLNFTKSRDALDVAARENAGSRKSIHDLSDIIEKITLNEKASESQEFAAKIQSSLQAFAIKSNATARNRGVKKAPFVVLVGTTMPAVLAEIGFISNPKDEALLKRPEHRQRLAEALYKGISRYADTLSRFEVAQGVKASSGQ
jgi:N-acetylmuramoyl-L-alanine amidase